MKNNIALLSIFLFVIICNCVRAEQVPFRIESPEPSDIFKPVINENIDSFVKGIMQNESMKGLSMAVVRSDGEVEFGSWGISTEYGDKVTPETLFGLASSSQMFSFAAWAILADDFHYGQNKTPLPPGVTTLRNRTPADKFFSDVVQCPSYEDRATAPHSNNILCGITPVPITLPYCPPGFFSSRTEISPYSEQDNIVDIIRRSDNLPGISSFDTAHNDILQMVTPHVIAQYSEMTFTDFVQERIFDNLSMSSTIYMPMEAEESGLMSHSWTHDGRRIPFYNSKNTHYSQLGVDGVITNAVDIAKWLKFLWSNRTDPDTNVTLISDASYNFVSSPIMSFAYRKRNGTGGKCTEIREASDMVHTIYRPGNLPGASSLVAFYPEGAFGLALLTNTDSSSELGSIFHHVIGETFNLEPPCYASRKISNSPPWFLKANGSSHGNSTTELPLDHYTGIYSSPGYGTIQLCSSQSNQTDGYCADVLESFRIVDNTTTHDHDSAPQLLASWPRKGSTHLRLAHRSGNTFSFDASTLFVNGYGMDKSPFEVKGPGLADYGKTSCSVFSVEDGLIVGFGILSCLNADHADRTMNKCRNYVAWFDKVA